MGEGHFRVDEAARLVMLYLGTKREHRLAMVPLYAARIEDLGSGDLMCSPTFIHREPESLVD